MAAISELKTHYFLVKSPKCEWLGQEHKALCLLGNHYKLAGHGEGKTLILSTSKRAEPFVLVGDRHSSCDILLASDKSFGLEINYRKEEKGNSLSIWNCNGDRYPHSKFVLNVNGTVSPAGQNKSKLVLGAKRGEQGIVLVGAGDPLQLVFQGDADLEVHRKEMAALLQREKEAGSLLRMAADLKCDQEMLKSLGNEGFIKLEGAVPKDLTDEALKYINMLIGQSSQGADQFKAKSFPNRTEITNLFNKSMLPYIMENLLGPLAGGRPYVQNQGQLAIRFPGDMCDPGECWSRHVMFALPQVTLL